MAQKNHRGKVHCRSLRVREEGHRAWVDGCQWAGVGVGACHSCRVCELSISSFTSFTPHNHLHSKLAPFHKFCPLSQCIQAIKQPALPGLPLQPTILPPYLMPHQVLKSNRNTSRRTNQLDACDRAIELSRFGPTSNTRAGRQ